MNKVNHSTTQIVRDVFKHFFDGNLKKGLNSKTKTENGTSNNNCGICENCQVPDCGNCNYCLSMSKFGGHSTRLQCKIKPRCLSISEEDETEICCEVVKRKKRQFSRALLHPVELIKKKLGGDKLHSRQYYTAARVGIMYINQGDDVMLASCEPNDPLGIVHIAYMFQDSNGEAMFHGQAYLRAIHSILGETADPRELFVVEDSCDDYPLGCIIKMAKVELMNKPKKWCHIGGKKNINSILCDDGKTYYFSKKYGDSRFTDYNPDAICASCKWQKDDEEVNQPAYFKDHFLDDPFVKWRDENYFIGTGVLLEPGLYKSKENTPEKQPIQDDQYLPVKLPQNKDNVFMSHADFKLLYPELYRKEKKVHINNNDVAEPYTIGIIEDIKLNNKKNIIVKVRLFYRPEDRKCKDTEGELHLLYWSEEVTSEEFKHVVRGKCYIAFIQNIENVEEWIRQGPLRFYFAKSYDHKKHITKEVPREARAIGDKRKRIKTRNVFENFPLWPEAKKRLRCLDIYAGCGGLSDGLEKSGLIDVKWAIEKEHTAARAFKLNHPTCNMFERDCNDVLEVLLKGNNEHLNFPKIEDVDMLVGGPPCQGFSVLNRFATRESSKINNSELETFIGFVDYYRPKYFVFENVRNFVTFKSSILLKLTLRCLLAIGYQITFGVLQAGNFGLPQSRRRFIMIGAAPGIELPKLPDPVHTFTVNGLSIKVDGIDYEVAETLSGNNFSLPYRRVTVKDAISDLPEVPNGSDDTCLPYDDSRQVPFYVKMLRQYSSNTKIITEHVCKLMGPLAAKRMELIPQSPGADWRDLPNVQVILNDGSTTEILEYLYRSSSQKANEPPKGVCLCALGKHFACNKKDKSYCKQTLIPWGCVHTADRNNQWSGVYGRLDWNGIFSTTTTNPEPSNTQGKVLHPNQNRVISVRESARAQGLHDDFKFFGTTSDKYRQIGNALPSLMSLAIGRSILKTHLEDFKGNRQF